MLAPVTIADVFSRSSTGSWGTTNSGQIWSGTGSQYSVANGAGVYQSAVNSALAFNYIPNLNHGIAAQTTSAVLMRVSTASSVLYPLTDFGPLLSFNLSNKTGYYLTLQGNYGEIAIGQFQNGSRSELARKSFPFSKNTPFWVRFERTPTSIRAKVWKEGIAEPTSWNITVPLSNALPAGSGGLFNRGTRDAYTVNVHAYYYYTKEEEESLGDVADTFNRTHSGPAQGLGVSSGGQVWEGAFSDSPDTYALGKIGTLGTVSTTITTTSTQEHAGILGGVRSGDIEATTIFNVNEATDSRLRLGIRGTAYYTNGVMGVNGIAIEYATTDDKIRILKRVNGVYTTLATSAGTMPFAANRKIRVQIIGSLIQARCWDQAGIEPSTWDVQVTDTTFSSGRLWLAVESGAATSTTYVVSDIIQSAPTLLNTDAATMAGTSSSATGTTITAIYSFTNDLNDNATIYVRYRPETTTVWQSINVTVTYNRAGPTKTAQGVITGLLPNTVYLIEGYMSDPDGILGVNPRIISQATNAEAIRSTALNILAVTDTTIYLEATYEMDSDNSSVGLIQYREVSSSIDAIADYFNRDDEGMYLQNSIADSETWEKHPQMTPSVTAINKNGRYYVNTVNASDKALYINTTPAAATTPEYDVTAQIILSSLNGYTGIAGRVNPTLETYYGAGIDGINRQWQLFRMSGGTKTILETVACTQPLESIVTLQLVIRDAYKAVVVDGVELMRSTDNTISTGNLSGYYATGIVDGSYVNQPLLVSFKLTYRSTTGSWSSMVGMTPDYINKRHLGSITGLTSDRVYEIQVSLFDIDGIYGPYPMSITTQTFGQSSAMSFIGATTNPTSAIVNVFYLQDSNNNASLECQYKSVMDTMWTTIPFSRFYADRVNNIFSTTLSGLSPTTSYNIRATLVDPDGIVEGTNPLLEGIFTTTGFTVEQDKQSKHYVWKVYNRDDEYLGTIPDAPEPEFTYYQNSGVTDLSLTLPRKMSEMTATGVIDFQNRIDIWVIDPSSNGMGPNFVDDGECDPTVGAWTLGSNCTYTTDGGPDGSSSLLIAGTASQVETLSNPIEIDDLVPFVFTAVAKTRGAKLRMFVRAYDVNDSVIGSSDQIADTVGPDWQKLTLEYTPPAGTAYLRIILRNLGVGQMWIDKVTALPKEYLIYRGRIESFTPKIDQDGESVSLDVLGLASLLSDDYIEFLQFVETQPQRDIEAGRISHGAMDPADMLKRVIDEARRTNPLFHLRYTAESIRYTGNLMQYTFRDQQIRNCFDKIRDLCPSGWHWYIGPSGLVTLRGAEHAPTHTLHLGREVQSFEVEKSIRNLKNYVRVKGRQDEDMSEADGFGSINYVAFDQESIDKYGKRTLFLRDAQLVDPESAKIVGDGRLDEMNRQEQRATIIVPDEKDCKTINGSLVGYNVQAFEPGDNIIIVDPIAGARNTFWDQFSWDEDTWDSSNVFMPIPESVPIKSVRIRGTDVELELSERPPSAISDFTKAMQWINRRNTED